jgi:hypothetical protein
MKNVLDDATKMVNVIKTTPEYLETWRNST